MYTPTMSDQVIIKDWVRKNVQSPLGVCKEVSHAFARSFPDYEVRFGFFHSALWGARQHWWCRHKETGGIVDPTGNQYPDGCVFPFSDLTYEDLTDVPKEELQTRVPTGVCAYCGERVFNHDTFCSDSCAKRCIDELNESIRESLE